MNVFFKKDNDFNHSTLLNGPDYHQLNKGKEKPLFVSLQTLYILDAVTLTKEIGLVPVRQFHAQSTLSSSTQDNHQKNPRPIAANDRMVQMDNR